MIYLGIDPGLDGAIAAIGDGEPGCDRVAGVIDTPTAHDGKRRRYVVNEMRTAILKLCQGGQIGRFKAAVERVHSMPKQGVVSSFTFGEGFGLWQGLLAGLSIPFDLVEPQRWKKALLDGAGKEKGASRIRAAQLFPGVDLRLVKHHGRGDALLIAEYRRRQG
jgi:hypothetical protein